MTATKIANPFIHSVLWRSGGASEVYTTIENVAAAMRILSVKSSKASQIKEQRPLGGRLLSMLFPKTSNLYFISTLSSKIPLRKLVQRPFSNQSSPPSFSYI
jgi:hypothetical protein